MQITVDVDADQGVNPIVNTAEVTASDQIDLDSTPGNGVVTEDDQDSITVTAPNDPPVNTVPGAQTTNEDTALVFSSGNSNLISISDVDAGSNDVQVSLAATNGEMTLNASAISALSFNSGDGTSDSSMEFEGTVLEINTALDGLSFLPDADENDSTGSFGIQIITNDLGNSGSGGALSDTDSVSISVTAVNDAPSFTANNPPTVLEDAGTQTETVATGFDPGANESSQTVQQYIVSNVVNVSLLTGLPTVDTSGVVSYTPAADAFGTVTFDLSVQDSGGTTNGGVDTSPTQSVTITITNVNDAPVAVDDPSYSTDEDHCPEGICPQWTRVES